MLPKKLMYCNVCVLESNFRVMGGQLQVLLCKVPYRMEELILLSLMKLCLEQTPLKISR